MAIIQPPTRSSGSGASSARDKCNGAHSNAASHSPPIPCTPPSLPEAEYTVVLVSDDDEPCGRGKILDRFVPPGKPVGPVEEHKQSHSKRHVTRSSLDLPNGTTTSIELVEFAGVLSDSAMLDYHAMYADAFVFVFSRTSPATLVTAQKQYEAVQTAVRRRRDGMRTATGWMDLGDSGDEDEGPGRDRPADVAFFLIGNADRELPVVGSRKELLETLRGRAKMVAQSWGCPYLEVDTSQDETHGVDEAVICIGQAMEMMLGARDKELAPASGTGPQQGSIRRAKPPQRYMIRRMLSKMMG